MSGRWKTKLQQLYYSFSDENEYVTGYNEIYNPQDNPEDRNALHSMKTTNNSYMKFYLIIYIMPAKV